MDSQCQVPKPMPVAGSISPMLPADSTGLWGNSVCPHPSSGSSLHSWQSTQGKCQTGMQPPWPETLCSGNPALR